MIVRPCEQLDEYLCGWLPPGDAAAFEAHLADCAACREECALQRQIDRLLAEGAVATAPVPIRLRSQLDGRIRAARRTRMLGWAGAAATVVAIAFGSYVIRNIVFSPREQRQAAQDLSTGNDAPPSVAPPTSAEPAVAFVKVTMIDPSSAIVMPLESRHPNVTLVRVFPTIAATGEDESPASPGAQDVEGPDIE